MRLAEQPDRASRESFLRRHPGLVRAGVVERLAEAVRQHVRVDVGMALGLAEGALAIARELGDQEALARGIRAKANALWFQGRYESAVKLFEKAVILFRELGRMDEAGRTLSSSIQPLALLGEYERAFSAAAEARDIFTRLRQPHRLARLELNFANVLHRRDCFAEALAAYERAYQQLLPYKDAEGIGVALHNMSVCLIALNDFHKAMETYQRARQFCEQHRMPLLVAQADYNIAYLYYLRGDYGRALESLRATRKACQHNGDPYHAALCNLDQSEVYLELNLSEEGAEMAQQAFDQFEQLGMGYEAARSLTNLAVALSQQQKASRALELFARARAIFVREKNRVWPALIDLYQALVLYHEDRFSEARRLCEAALDFFQPSVLHGKTVLCHLLLARLTLRSGGRETASYHCKSALEQLAEFEAPVLDYQAHFLMGQVQEASGDPLGAYDSYQTARCGVETLRSSIRGEELKIAFMENKLEVYERLIQLCLSRHPDPAAAEEAFAYIEQSKGRTLMDLIFGRAQPLAAKTTDQSELIQRIRELRESLNWYYHCIELEELRQDGPSRERIERLRAQARSRENELQRVLRELPESEADTATPATLPLREIRAALDSDTTLVEFFRVAERFVAAVLRPESLEILPLAPVSQINNLLRMLQFQLSKFRLAPDYIASFRNALMQATETHLRELYEALVAPLAPRLQGRHLVVAPHDVLHYLPFHALFDGRRYLIDQFAVSYAPSASIYAARQRKRVNKAGPSLILGVPDRRTPFIRREARSVAAVVPEPELFLAASASEQVLREKGPASRLVHIASHGCFRRDNPMFSTVGLGGSYLTVYDLYHLELPVELLTLSGCGTGLNVVAAGDELLGLIRGLLYAGAQSVLLTLWDVHDRSTADFMKSFYGRLRNQPDKALAVQQAMFELRERYPHPYYWAPFMLVCH